MDEWGIANVISLKMLEEKFHMMYDSKMHGGAFVCEMLKGQIIFRRCPITSFPYINLNQDELAAAAMLLQMIRQNFEGYTQEEIERAILARKMHARSGYTSKAAFKKEVSQNSESLVIKDSPLTPADVTMQNKYLDHHRLT